MSPQKQPDPTLFIIPNGYIELTEAVTQTVKLWFGQKYITDLASNKTLRNELALSIKQRIDRRWDFVRQCFRRAFIQKRLKVYLLNNNIPAPIDYSFWQDPLSSLHPFGTPPLGKPRINVFVIEIDQWRLWAENHTRKLAIEEKPVRSRIAFQLRPNLDQSDIEPNFKHTSLALPNSRKTGPKPMERIRIIKAIYEALDFGSLTYKELADEKGSAFAKRFNGKEYTTGKARKYVIEQLQERNCKKHQPTANNNK